MNLPGSSAREGSWWCFEEEDGDGNTHFFKGEGFVSIPHIQSWGNRMTGIGFISNTSQVSLQSADSNGFSDRLKSFPDEAPVRLPLSL